MSIGYIASYPPANPIVLEFGIYRDGNNNLDQAEAPVIPQALKTSAFDPRLEYNIKDTTGTGNHVWTYTYTIDHGTIFNYVQGPRQDMSAREVLADFVASTLDRAEANGAKQTWIELVNHGAGDAGALFTIEPDGHTRHMTVDELAGAIADGIALHAQRHPEDANRRIDGVMMHACFELSVAVAAALSAVGVTYLAASPETTIAPGVPSSVAHDIADNISDPQNMATSIVHDVMTTHYILHGLVYSPTAVFDVLDISPKYMQNVELQERLFNAIAINKVHQRPAVGKRLLADASQVPGMQRDDPTASVPWRADRPAIALYLRFAADPQLPPEIRQQALATAKSITALILAHGETHGAVGFGADYRDVIGPTTRFPIDLNQIDPLSPDISETASTYAYNSGRNMLISALLLQANIGAAAPSA